MPPRLCRLLPQFPSLFSGAHAVRAGLLLVGELSILHSFSICFLLKGLIGYLFKGLNGVNGLKGLNGNYQLSIINYQLTLEFMVTFFAENGENLMFW